MSFLFSFLAAGAIHSSRYDVCPVVWLRYGISFFHSSNGEHSISLYIPFGTGCRQTALFPFLFISSSVSAVP